MKKTRILLLLSVMLLPLLFSSCGGEETHINVDESQLYGLWVKSNSQEYWRYRSDGTGVTWDESEDITEEESNLTYRWTLQTDRLTHVFSGAQGNQAVPKVYTITEITASTMKWKDDYSMEYTFTKIN